jgi:hypothetical protein
MFHVKRLPDSRRVHPGVRTQNVFAMTVRYGNMTIDHNQTIGHALTLQEMRHRLISIGV